MKIVFNLAIILMFAINAFGQWIYIDPGHGGPGGDQYNNGGDGSGSVGEYGTSEQWINLKVALAMRDTLLYQGCVEEIDFKLSRMHDTTDISLEDRVAQADLLDMWQLISVHHNGLPSGADQGTEVVWCNSPTFIGGLPRDSVAFTDTLPRKVRYELLDAFGYQDRCFVQNQANPMHATSCLNCSKYIVKQAAMANVISEASDISHHPDEEALYVSVFSGHAEAEASALLTAWESYCARQGFGRIEYKCLRLHELENLDCPVYVDYQPYLLPYERCWPLDESHVIQAMNFEEYGYQYTFHHWAEIWYTLGAILNEHYDNPWYIYAPDITHDNMHYIVGFFTGGPFQLTLILPQSTKTKIYNDSLCQLFWGAPEGVLNSCSLYVDYSADSMQSWTNIIGPVPYNYGFTKDAMGQYYWDPPDIDADNCFLRMRARDYVDNADTVISHRFKIGPSFVCGDANNDEAVNMLDILYIIAFVYEDGPAPIPFEAGDVNNSGSVNLLDILALIDNLYDEPIGDPVLICPE